MEGSARYHERPTISPLCAAWCSPSPPPLSLSLHPSPHSSFPCAGGNPYSRLTAVDEARHYVTGSGRARQPALISVSMQGSKKAGGERQAAMQGPHPIFMRPLQNKFLPRHAPVQYAAPGKRLCGKHFASDCCIHHVPCRTVCSQ